MRKNIRKDNKMRYRQQYKNRLNSKIKGYLLQVRFN